MPKQKTPLAARGRGVRHKYKKTPPVLPIPRAAKETAYPERIICPRQVDYITSG